MPRSKSVLFVFATGLLVSGPVLSATKPVAHMVKIENMQFSPAELTVSRGDTVTWENLDLVPHTVTAENHRFDSKTIDPGRKWKLVVQKSETVEYKCLFHLPMKARLIIR